MNGSRLHRALRPSVQQWLRLQQRRSIPRCKRSAARRAEASRLSLGRDTSATEVDQASRDPSRRRCRQA